ncbi:MAG: MBL fold metallo-hydrolase [Acidimicrobiaceae bacterium]|nr:MBL fold metallo-hydrolase [Acidimicrobiaceae bacterium]
MKLTILGSSGSYPGPQSACSSYLVSQDGYNFLLDAGNGSMSNLFGACSPAKVDAIFISHGHSDHWADLVGIYYYCLFAERPLKPITLLSSKAVADLLLEQIGKENLLPVFELKAVDGADSFTLGPFYCTTARTSHSIPTFAIRVESQGKGLTYTADTGESSSVEELAMDTELLLAECTWRLGHSYSGPPLHHDPATLAALIIRANVKKAMITHVAYPNDRLEVADQLRSLVGQCEVLVAQDTISISIDIEAPPVP